MDDGRTRTTPEPLERLSQRHGAANFARAYRRPYPGVPVGCGNSRLTLRAIGLNMRSAGHRDPGACQDPCNQLQLKMKLLDSNVTTTATARTPGWPDARQSRFRPGPQTRDCQPLRGGE